jgi:hypothetical protein
MSRSVTKGRFPRPVVLAAFDVSRSGGQDHAPSGVGFRPVRTAPERDTILTLIGPSFIR